MEQQIIPDGYKQTEVGVIPNDWDLKKIGEFANVSSGGTPNRENKGYWEGNIPWVTTTLIKGKEITTAEHFITVEGLNNSATKWFKKGTILMAMYGQGKTRGQVAILGIDATINQACAAITINSKDNQSYILHFLKSQYEVIRELSNSGGQENLSGSIVKSILIPLPPEKEQTAIANALSDVDALITSIEKLIAKKQAIKTATMQQLLTGKKRLPPFDLYQKDGQEGTLEGKNEDKKKGLSKGTQQTKLVEIPKDWAVETITSISAVPMQNGLFYEPSRKGQGISLINVGDMYKSAPINVEQLELFNANVAEIKTFRVSSGDLFFTRSSIVPSGIAFCNIYESDHIERDVVFDSHLIRVRVNAKMADAKYVYLACLSNLARKFLISSAKTATMTTIDQGAIKNCPILLPSLEEQKLIVQILSDMDFELEGINKRLAKTQQIKRGMMQELLTGKTRLPIS